jgi:hypothetical protein
VNGTWKTTGGGGAGLGVLVLGGLGALAIGTGTVTAVATDLTNMIEVALACAAGVVLIVATAVVLVWRKSGRRPGEMPAPMREQIAAFHVAREAERLRAVPQRQQIAAPAQHLHYHYHAAPEQPEEMPAALRAIPERNQR